MHIIDRKWSNLPAGYQAIQTLQARLESEFGRAVQTGRQQKFRRELSEWEKRRRVLFSMAAIAPLSIITLCLAAFYFREVACVIVYWAILVLIILVTLAVAGRNYIVGAVNRPEPGDAKTLAVDLEQRWWASLSSNEPPPAMAEAKELSAFLAALDQALPADCLAIREPGPLLVCPAGVWLFQLVSWNGTILKQAGVWKLVQSVRDKWGQKRSLEQICELAPDDEWLRRKGGIEKMLTERLPQRAWAGDPIQGGVAFTHPKAVLDKLNIQGNTAAYGATRGWAGRILRAPAVAALAMPVQLEILEALQDHPGEATASAEDEADRLYRQAVGELRQSIAEMVG